MSALGHEQTSRHVRAMSVIPLKADIRQRGWRVRYVPIADMVITRQLVDHAGCMVSMSFTGCGGRYQEQCEPHFVGRHINDGEPILFRRFERFALPQDLLNSNGTVGIRAPTDGDRVGCSPEVRYPWPTIPDGTDLSVG
jgi:hypothetical protein